MDDKEFFKPNYNKILLTIILFILLGILLAANIDNFVWSILRQRSDVDTLVGSFIPSTLEVIEIIISVVIPYTLSCLIFFKLRQKDLQLKKISRFRYFLSPNKRKAILFIILLLLIPVPTWIERYPQGYSLIMIPSFLCVCYLYAISLRLDFDTFIPWILYTLYLTILPYFIACSLSFAYDKLKKK